MQNTQQTPNQLRLQAEAACAKANGDDWNSMFSAHQEGEIDARLAGYMAAMARPYDADTVRILVQCGEHQVLHIVTCVALDHLNAPEHALGSVVYEMTKAVRQKEPT